MISCRELFKILIFYPFIKWSHCIALSWLFHVIRYIIIYSRSIWTIYNIWSISRSKNMGSLIHRILTIDLIASNSRIFSLFSIGKWSICPCKRILSLIKFRFCLQARSISHVGIRCRNSGGIIHLLEIAKTIVWSSLFRKIWFWFIVCDTSIIFFILCWILYF